MKIKFFVVGLIFLLVILSLFLHTFHFSNPSANTQIHTNKKIQNKTTSSRVSSKFLPNFFIRDKKLPLPPRYEGGSISGTLTYKNALEIAKDYYERGAYKEALLWAYRADQRSFLDKDTWILYAKSLHHLGYKTEALAVLRAYQIFTTKQ